MTTIPADEIVALNPSVLAVGGSAQDIIALFLTTSTQIPIGQVVSFPDADSVSAYFGPATPELAAATIYFAGFEGASKLPAALLMAQYNKVAVAGYNRGGSMAGVALADVQAATGQFIISVDGTVETIANVDLSSATSMSNAASLLQTAINADAGANVVVTFDSVAQAFVITSTTTGAASAISFASGSGTVDTVLKLTAATGAQLSAGAIAAVPATFMNALTAVNKAWATFTSIFDPDASGNTVKLAFASWTGTQNKRFAYIPWDADPTPATQLPDSSCLMAEVEALNIDGVAGVWGPDGTKAFFMCGIAASINFAEKDGRTTFAFRQQDGLVADVTTATAANNLAGNPQGTSRGNGYNFYGAYGAAADTFIWLQRGFVSGVFLWLDSFINQIWFNNAAQSALLNFFKNAKSVAFNTAGNSLIETALADTIAAALNFGMFAPGTITGSQAASVNNAAGANVSDSLQAQGYYVQITPTSGTVRANRGPVLIKIWYLDRGSVQSITLDTIAVQ